MDERGGNQIGLTVHMCVLVSHLYQIAAPTHYTVTSVGGIFGKKYYNTKHCLNYIMYMSTLYSYVHTIKMIDDNWQKVKSNIYIGMEVEAVKNFSRAFVSCMENEQRFMYEVVHINILPARGKNFYLK